MRAISIFLGSLALVTSTQGICEPDFGQRLGKFDGDAKVCREFLTGKDVGICAQVAELAKSLQSARPGSNPSPADEGEPLEKCYYLAGKVRFAELADTEMLLDTIEHYYMLDDYRLFVVSLTTPHADELRQLSEGPLTEADMAPEILGLLFQDGVLKQDYSRQGETHPDIPRYQIDDALSAYRDLLGIKKTASTSRNGTGISACLPPG